MIKVTIRRLRAGLTGASGLVLLGGGDAGCATPTANESLGSSSGAATTTQPATGTLSLTWGYLSPTVHWTFNVQGATDEFVRVGDTMNVQLPSYYVWQLLHPEGAALPDDVERIRGLNVMVDVQAISGEDVLTHSIVSVSSWSGTSASDYVGQTDTFVVPPNADTLAFSIVIVDPADGNRRVEAATLDFQTVPVFGGSLPKHLLFDNNYGALRQRIIEGGELLANGSTMVTYTDWRADELVDRSSLDTQIGTINSYTRFGQVYEMPIHGQIAYDVSFASAYAYVADGDTTPQWSWFWESTLPSTTTSRALFNAAGRTAWEEEVYLPPTATDMQIYFHVKAYVVADYSNYNYAGSNLTKRYPDGGKVLLAERWDNLNGQAYQNYDFAVQAAP